VLAGVAGFAYVTVAGFAYAALPLVGILTSA
jgi:hypothetical protein